MTIKQTETIDAILAIDPDAKIIIRTTSEGTETIDWGDTTEISQSDIDAKKVELEEEWTAQEYARKRVSATGYPSIPDQLDEIYHNGIDSWKAVIKVTKDKYPKS